MHKLATLLLLVILSGSIASKSLAEESNYMSDSPLIYAIAGLLIVDIGASLNNGFALINDRPNKINGYFGVVTGVISLGLVAANLAMEDDDDLRNNFAIVMGSAGAASLILGAINVRRSGESEKELLGESKIILYPTLTWDRDQKYSIGININVPFGCLKMSHHEYCNKITTRSPLLMARD